MTALRYALAAWLVCYGLTACGGSSASTGSVPQPAPTDTTPVSAGLNFRFVNGSPGTGGVDVYLYQQGALRPAVPTFSNVPFGAITPYAVLPEGFISMDILHAGAVSTSLPITNISNLTQFVTIPTEPITRLSVVLDGTGLSGTRGISEFPEPVEPVGQSALLVHHASPAANILASAGPIGIGVYSAARFPAGTLPSALGAGATEQLFSFAFAAMNAIMSPLPNTAGGGFIYLTPFPVAPLPSAVGFAIGLPSTNTNARGPLASVIANAVLSETASENSPYANQTAISANAAETFGNATHVSEFLIDSDQNGNVGLIGTLDP